MKKFLLYSFDMVFWREIIEKPILPMKNGL